MIQFDEHMFEMGWFNHQADNTDANMNISSAVKHLTDPPGARFARLAAVGAGSGAGRRRRGHGAGGEGAMRCVQSLVASMGGKDVGSTNKNTGDDDIFGGG